MTIFSTARTKYPDQADPICQGELRQAKYYLYTERDPAKSRQALQAILKASPESASTTEIMYQTAYCSFAEKDYQACIDQCADIIAKRPPSDWNCYLQYFIGTCYMQMKKPNEAKAAFWKTVDLYPGTNWAKLAQASLTALNDPIPLYDGLTAEWQVQDPVGGSLGPPISRDVGEGIDPETGRLVFTFVFTCTPLHVGTYQVTCTIDDPHAPSDPDNDQPIVVTGSFEVKCEFEIGQIFSTDLVNTASGSTVGGLVGAEVTWTAGFPPMVTAKHECEYLTTPQSTLV